MVIAAERIRTLNKYEKSILNALERGMKHFAWVPLDQIKMVTRLSESEVNYRLARLIDWGMVRFNPVPYDGYSLVFGGYDALALMTLTRNGTISALGSKIGEGKESVVYEALGLGPVAIKAAPGWSAIILIPQIKQGLYARGRSLSLADRITEIGGTEYQALTALHPKVSVPLPIGQNRHAVVMALINGPNLNHCVLEEPEEVLDDILLNAHHAYHEGIIHADLSEYNILMDEGKCVLIDWPQSIGTTHPNAETILERDIDNVLSFFKRKYNMQYDRGDAIRCVID